MVTKGSIATKVILLVTTIILIATVLLYPYPHRYISGGLEMTEWANPSYLTNYSVGFFLFWIFLGTLSGILLPRYIFKNLTPRKKLIFTTTTIFLICLLIALVFSIIGVEGFRFG